MNSSKKIGIIALVVVVVIVIFALVKMDNGTTPVTENNNNSTSTTNTNVTPTSPTSVAEGSNPVAVSETNKVSNTLSEYQNAELGISVKYPTTWQKEEVNSGISFILPVDKAQVSTVNSMIGSIQATSDSCSFPPITSIKARETIKVGSSTVNMISIANNVQGRNYFDRLFTLKKGDICYRFTFAAISLSPTSNGLTGSSATQAENNNKAIINTADSQFTDVVKSFTVITTPKGIDETQAPK